MTAKTIEKSIDRKVKGDDRPLFKAAISVAPVTDWLFYDSVYTERYMKLPTDPGNTYERSAVEDTRGFQDLAKVNGEYLLCHGTGDGNPFFF